MASIKKIKEQLENVNELGIANLAKKGVELPLGTTTYEIMQNIARLGDASEEPKTTFKADSCVAKVILPVTMPTTMAEIKFSVEADSSASLEG